MHMNGECRPQHFGYRPYDADPWGYRDGRLGRVHHSKTLGVPIVCSPKLTRRLHLVRASTHLHECRHGLERTWLAIAKSGFIRSGGSTGFREGLAPLPAGHLKRHPTHRP